MMSHWCWVPVVMCISDVIGSWVIYCKRRRKITAALTTTPDRISKNHISWTVAVFQGQSSPVRMAIPVQIFACFLSSIKYNTKCILVHRLPWLCKHCRLFLMPDGLENVRNGVWRMRAVGMPPSEWYGRESKRIVSFFFSDKQ
jgi:hypothetical protein